MADFSRLLREALKRLLEGRRGMGENAASALRRMNPDQSDLNRIGDMFDDSGRLLPPEQALGRPLTPDHIWNDPRFQHRLAMTSDLEGAATPAERFQIAADRIAASPRPSGANDLDAWRGDRKAMLTDLIRRQRSIEGSAGGARVTNPVTMDDIIETGTDPNLARSYDDFAQGYLGHFGAGGSASHLPLLGTAIAAGLGGGMTLREALRQRQWRA